MCLTFIHFYDFIKESIWFFFEVWRDNRVWRRKSIKYNNTEIFNRHVFPKSTFVHQPSANQKYNAPFISFQSLWRTKELRVLIKLVALISPPSPLIRKTNKPIQQEKSPTQMMWLTLLCLTFPNAKFIRIYIYIHMYRRHHAALPNW